MGSNFHKFTMCGSARSIRRGGTVNSVENSQLVQILSFRSYGVVGFVLFPKSPTTHDLIGELTQKINACKLR